MKKYFTVSIVLLLAITGTLMANTSIMHPAIQLKDKQGKNVLQSGQPLSTTETCGECHDAEYINQHNYHASLGFKELIKPATEGSDKYPWELTTGSFGNWNPLTYDQLSPVDDKNIEMGTVDWLLKYGKCHVGGGPAELGQLKSKLTDYNPKFDPLNGENSFYNPKTGQREPWDWKASGTAEPNCLLCHLKNPDNSARISEMKKGHFKWANTATINNKDIVRFDGQQWKWNPKAFSNDGLLKKNLIDIQAPSTENCAQCHKMAVDKVKIPEGAHRVSFTESLTGVIFSAEQMHKSAVNLKGKTELTRSWDIHAERMLNCNSCHFSINNPAFYKESDRTRPIHLKFDGRKMTNAEFLHRPSHKLANMRIQHEIENSEPDNVVHRCESCHDPKTGHEFLPYKNRHIWALGCESCHIPKLYTPALQQIDWTLINPEGEAVTKSRGFVEGATDGLVEGYEPAWFTRTLADNSSLLPYNLVTSWFWVDSIKKQPVSKKILRQAMLDGDQYQPDVLAALDDNKDGKLDISELKLDSDEKTEFIKNKLIAAGVSDPEIKAEIRPFSIHHGTVGRKGAIRECYECHGSDSRFTKTVELASFIPNNVMPVLAPGSDIKLEGEIEKTESGQLLFHPRPIERGLYLFGQYRNQWVDIIGMLSLLGVLFGISLHGGLRIFMGKPATNNGHKVERVYMYPVYERLWHWLQAGSILIFSISGLEIHFADKFSLIGYANAVRIHEIVAIIFIINALLSIAYHITAGEIKHYLPQPKSFIDESWKQAIYYIKGIFQGADHPIEKTPERRLNPIQQVTYLMILYVLIPIQVATGIIIWGAERWPVFLESVGGLSIIAPIHTLCAWFFISFLIMHIYMTTTGHTPLANIIAMITGWEDVEMKKTKKGNNEK